MCLIRDTNLTPFPGDHVIARDTPTTSNRTPIGKRTRWAQEVGIGL